MVPLVNPTSSGIRPVPCSSAGRELKETVLPSAAHGPERPGAPTTWPKTQTGFHGGRLGPLHPGSREGFPEEVTWELGLDGLVKLVRGKAG